jgi:hypothetical protein
MDNERGDPGSCAVGSVGRNSHFGSSQFVIGHPAATFLVAMRDSSQHRDSLSRRLDDYEQSVDRESGINLSIG